MSRILIVEDEAHLATGLRFNLEAEGYGAETVETGEAALERLTADDHGFDLALVDVMLPGIDGFELVRRLREGGEFMPVMMLTARGQTNDVLYGFEMGADDYVAKPFDLSILLARIQGLLRRRGWTAPEPDEAEAPLEAYGFGTVRFDETHRRLERRGTEHPLTVMESNLLRFLIRHEGRAVDRKTLLEEVWGVRSDTDTRAVDNFIVRLRRYIEDDPQKPRHLETVRGVGYRFVKEPDAPST